MSNVVIDGAGFTPLIERWIEKSDEAIKRFNSQPIGSRNNESWGRYQAYSNAAHELKAALFNRARQPLIIDEGQRQMIILALAKLSMERPGWCHALEEIALLMDNKGEDGRPEMFENFRRTWTQPLVDKLTEV